MENEKIRTLDPTPPEPPQATWAASMDGEIFDSGGEPGMTREAARKLAIVTAIENGEDDAYIGRAVKMTAGHYAGKQGNRILEDAGENAGRLLPEDIIGDWPNTCTSEQEADLDAFIANAFDAWATKHNLQPTFFQIKDIEGVSVTDEHREQYANDE